MSDFDTILADYDTALLKMQRQQNDLMSKVADLQEEITRKNDLLAHQSRMAMLGEVTASVAHEIRNPLGGIRLYLDLICREGGLTDSPNVGKVRGIISRLDRVVNDILHHSREIVPQRQPIALANVIMDAVSLAESELGAGSIKLRVDVDDSSANIDADLISQLLLNLIMNAAQILKQEDIEEATVNISAKSESGRAVFSIQDNGPGIPKDQLDRLFTPFFSNKDGGTGLGLALCKRIVDAHRGSITAENTYPGAKFVVSI
ncbi:MAG: ATP-binding protein [Planctomycetota bacterium]